MRRETAFTAGPNDEDARLDRLLRKLLKDVPLSHIYRMIRRGQVRVNGKRAKTGTRIHAGDEIAVPKREGAEAEIAAGASSALRKPEKRKAFPRRRL